MFIFFIFKAEKRAHHNALERRRRDHIKESFSNLREAVPTLKGEKVSEWSNLRDDLNYYMRVKRQSSLSGA